MIPSERAILLLSSISMLALLLAAGQPVEPVRAARPSKALGENNGLSVQQPGILNCTDAIRIMPLGDSITVGFSSGVMNEAYMVAYRKDLWESLKAWRYSINFVGSREHGWAYESTLGFDPDHEGHGGWHAKGGTGGGIAPNIYNWLVAKPADVVLLHIGTNDISNNGQNASEVGEILDVIDRFSKDITVILALIINRNPYNPATTQFNNAVKNMALNRINQIGDKIIIVDMENGANLVYTQQPQGDMWDNKHPYATGYQKMANVWGNTLANLLPVCAVNDSFTVDEDSLTALIDVLANDRGANLQLTETSSASHSGIVSQNGTMIEYQPAPDFFGTETITYTINDGPPGSIITATVTVAVNPVNDPPRVNQPGLQMNAEGATVSLQIEASDPDEDALSFKANGLPSGLALNPVTGLISGTLAANSRGDYAIQVEVSDGNTEGDVTVEFGWRVAKRLSSLFFPFHARRSTGAPSRP